MDRQTIIEIMMGIYGCFGYFLGHHFGYQKGYKDAMYHVQTALENSMKAIQSNGNFH